MTVRRRRFSSLVVAASSLGAIGLVVSGARATIQEQRARLPPAAHDCPDEVEGIWKSHQYDPRYGDWTVFTLTVRRVAGKPGELTGVITNHSWDGPPTQEQPPPCINGWRQWIVSMDARGTVDAQGNIFFGGVPPWRLDRVICYSGPAGYNLDNFTGRIDPVLKEFQSVNNDGGRAVNDPTVFRRIGCLDEESPPQIVATPPPFYPSMGRGCVCAVPGFR
ncbi:MAG: hypothetical protein NZ898_08800 [Myxococcota bacterium]|nr:hypothetical protein [Myxococcota bacterium]MDW8363932.1 hypothetical protein [Myxococcales bacterium]